MVARAAATDLPPRLKKPAPIIINNQVLHSITEERLDVLHSITDHVEKNVSGGAARLRPHCFRPVPYLGEGAFSTSSTC